MICPRCGLPDYYAGDGDGIGSCECPRCECCGAGPDECDCQNDWDHFAGFYDDEVPTDYLCNDPECGHLRLRLEARAKENTRS